jgi:hypothetical protein
MNKYINVLLVNLNLTGVKVTVTSSFIDVWRKLISKSVWYKSVVRTWMWERKALACQAGRGPNLGARSSSFPPQSGPQPWFFLTAYLHCFCFISKVMTSQRVLLSGVSQGLRPQFHRKFQLLSKFLSWVQSSAEARDRWSHHLYFS